MAVTAPFEPYEGDDPFLFVTYSHRDTKSVYNEIRWLHEAGFNVWFDQGIEPGSRWRAELASAISNCALLVVYITENSAHSERCWEEIEFALNRNTPVIAIHLRETELPDVLALSIGSKQAIMRYKLSPEQYRDRVGAALAGHLDNAGRKIPLPPKVPRVGTLQKWAWAAATIVITVAITLLVRFEASDDVPLDTLRRIQDHYLQGIEYLRMSPDIGMLEKAEAAFQAAIDIDPDYARAQAGICQTRAAIFRATNERDHIRAAEVACDHALRTDGDLWEVRVAIGNLKRDKGDYDQSIAELLAARDVAPDQHEVYSELARSYSARGDVDLSEKAFLKSIELHPGFWGYHQDLGVHYYRQGRYEEAAKYYRNAMELASDSTPASINFANVSYMLGNLDDAEQGWRTSVEVRDNRRGREGLALIQMERGCFAAAADQAVAGIRLDPLGHGSWGALATACEALGAVELSRAYYQNAAHYGSRDPGADTWWIRRHLGLYWAHTGALSLAREVRDELERNHADQAAAHYYLAVINHYVGDALRSEAAERRAIELGYPPHALSADIHIGTPPICPAAPTYDTLPSTHACKMFLDPDNL